MRFVSAGIVVGSLLFASLAYAAEGKGANDSGKGGPGPGSAPEQGSSGADNAGPAGEEVRVAAATKSTTGDEDEEANPDKADPFAKAYKPWEVGVSFETHRLVIQNDLAGGDAVNGPPGAGAGADKMLNAYSAFVRYDITKHDHLRVIGFMTESFMADSGESGVRLDDTAVAYTHSFPLPKKFNLDANFTFTIPTGFMSYKAGTITALRLGVGVDRKFGPLFLELKTGGAYDIQTEESYSLAAGGAPTAQASVNIAGSAELQMPFYNPLSAGLGAYTGYSWLNDIAAQLPAVQDPTFKNQPIQQNYGGEVYIRYLIPMLAGVKPDITFAYAMGDGTLGYTQFLHDGVGHFYVGYRETAEFYATLSLRY
jgi:hypothetical protein